MKPWKKILCPVDFSTTSRAAAHAATELAVSLDAELTLLHTYELPGFALPEGVVYASPSAARELLDEITRALGEWKQEAEERGAKQVKIETAIGPPAEQIVLEAGKGYDVIVIGTHGRTGLSHLLMGSVAERVVRKAPCPVLTVRHAAKD
jgi:nucleotide-binding universal stress UspA family protein